MEALPRSPAFYQGLGAKWAIHKLGVSKATYYRFLTRLRDEARPMPPDIIWDTVEEMEPRRLMEMRMYLELAELREPRGPRRDKLLTQIARLKEIRLVREARPESRPENLSSS